MVNTGLYSIPGLVGRFSLNTPVDTASAQYRFERYASSSIDRTDSARVLLSLSATPFCCGVLGTVFWCFISSSLRYFSNTFEVYSPPMSVLRALRFFLLCLSTRAFHSRKRSKTWSLLFNTYNYVNLDLSSMNNRKYFPPPRDFSCIFPHTSEWTSSKISVVWVVLLDKGLRWCLPPIHVSQNPFSFDVIFKLFCQLFQCNFLQVLFSKMTISSLQQFFFVGLVCCVCELSLRFTVFKIIQIFNSSSERYNFLLVI